MSDLIDRQAAIDEVAYWYGIDVSEALCRLPSAEPERKKGKWIPKRSGRFYYGCSICGEPIPTDNQLDYIDSDSVHFCPNCGADMRGGTT